SPSATSVAGPPSRARRSASSTLPSAARRRTCVGGSCCLSGGSAAQLDATTTSNATPNSTRVIRCLRRREWHESFQQWTAVVVRVPSHTPPHSCLTCAGEVLPPRLRVSVVPQPVLALWGRSMLRRRQMLPPAQALYRTVAHVR